MSYRILGRNIKNEHIALGVLATTIGAAIFSTRGGDKKGAVQAGQSVQVAKSSVPINASSTEEEEFIKKYIAEAEKNEATH